MKQHRRQIAAALSLTTMLVIVTDRAAGAHEVVGCDASGPLEPLVMIIHQLTELVLLIGVVVAVPALGYAGLVMLTGSPDSKRRAIARVQRVLLGVALLVAAPFIIAFLISPLSVCGGGAATLQSAQIPVLMLSLPIPLQVPGAAPPGLIEVLFSPFRELAQVMSNTLFEVMWFSPRIHPNPPVEQIHQLTFQVAIVVSGLIVAAAGIYLIFGVEVGVSYEQARLMLPRLIIGVAFSTVSLQVLQLFGEFANAFSQAFRPTGPFAIEQLAGLTTSLVLVWFINAWLLLGLVLLFVFRAGYLLAGAATSPLIAVAWALPNTRRYAESFASAWFALLAVGPIDILLLRFNLELLAGTDAVGLQPVANWIIGVASFALMLWVPLQLYGASQTIVGRSVGVATKTGASVDKKRGSGGQTNQPDQNLQNRRRTRRRNRYNRRRRF